MHVTLRQLSVFEAAAKQLSFTRAAEQLHLSQPAVSMQIRQLEEAAGLPLFEKLGKQIYLTDAGREVFHYSQLIGQQLREMSEVMEAMKGGKRGHLRISVASTANYFATRLLANFTRRFVGTTFSLDVTNRKSLLEQLVENETDVVIMGQPPADMNLVATAFMENPLVVIAPPEHPLARSRKTVPLQKLEHETFVVREQDSGTRIAMERHFAEHGIRVKAGMEMTSNEAIKQAVEAGLGMGIVSIHTLELELETKRLAVLKVENFPIMRHWYMVYLEGKRLPPVAEAFRDYLSGEDAAPLLRSPILHPVAQAAGAVSDT